MEFKFRAVDDRPATHFPPSSAQPFLGGYPSADPQGIVNPVDHRQEIQRQLEKERIREEIMAAEIARRRTLEAEVRMELMMEREMVMRRAAEFGLSLEERVAMRFDPRYPFMIPHPVNGWVFEDPKLPLPATGMLPLPPIQPLPEAELKPEPNKDKIIFLAKPDPNLCGAKRKAETAAAIGASEPSSSDSTKKPKEEWSCALCRVCPTSEKGLNEHLQGKKHKAMEAGLLAERASKKSTSGQLAKKTCKPKHADDKSLAQNVIDPEKEPLQNAEQVKKGEAMSDIKKQQKFKYWCEMCKVGAYSEIVMENHKNGKKHVGRLKGVNVNETVPAKSRTPDSNTAKKVKEEAAEDVDAPHLPPL